MKTLKTIIFITLYNLSFGQDSSLYVNSWKNPKKIEKIENNTFITIRLNKDTTIIGIPKPTEYRGVILYVRQNDLVMSVSSELQEQKTYNGTVINTSNTITLPDSLRRINGSLQINDRRYVKIIKKEKINALLLSDSAFRLNNYDLRTININDIRSISHSSTSKVSDIAGGLAVVSVITALVIAPLVSINYKTGNFNQKTYYSVLAGSGIGFAIGLPLNLLLGNYKHYNIKNYVPTFNDNNYYSIKSK